MTEKQIARFWAKVKILGPEDCWEWKASLNGCGYGHVGINGKMFISHRVAWELTYGPIPKGLCICHKCDNPPCINPNHLFIGTQQDNVTDMESKGRAVRSNGEKNGKAKLTKDQVIEIRRLYAIESHMSLSAIGRAFGVTPSAIYNIVNRKFWKHI